MAVPPGERERRLPPDATGGVDRVARLIPVDHFIRRYDVTDPHVIEALRQNPTLCYLLGRVTDKPEVRYSVGHNANRSVHILTEGSGMFNLRHPEDAMEWKGIFNHIVGSVAHTEALLDMFSNATADQRAEFKARGYNFDKFDKFGKENMKDVMFITHAGRRQMDEHNWYGIEDDIHPTGDSYENTRRLLSAAGAPQVYLNLLEVENHDVKLAESINNNGKFSDITMAILTYADWTYAQKPTPLAERFSGLRKSQRASSLMLSRFEPASTAFEQDMIDIFGVNVFDEIKSRPQKEWDKKVRQAYCAPSGLSVKDVFPPVPAAG
jgi:hypothetical protein